MGNASGTEDWGEVPARTGIGSASIARSTLPAGDDIPPEGEAALGADDWATAGSGGADTSGAAAAAATAAGSLAGTLFFVDEATCVSGVFVFFVLLFELCGPDDDRGAGPRLYISLGATVIVDDGVASGGGAASMSGPVAFAAGPPGTTALVRLLSPLQPTTPKQQNDTNKAWDKFMRPAFSFQDWVQRGYLSSGRSVSVNTFQGSLRRGVQRQQQVR